MASGQVPPGNVNNVNNAPLQNPNQPAPAYARSRYDTNNRRAQAFPTDQGCHGLIFRNIEVPHYIDDAVHHKPLLPLVFQMVNLGYCYWKGITGPTYALPRTIGDMVMPNMDDDMFLPTREARIAFIRSAVAFLCKTGAAAIPNAQGLSAEDILALPTRAPYPDATWVEFKNGVMTAGEPGPVIDATMPLTEATTDANLVVYVELITSILVYIANHMRPGAANNVDITAYVTCYLSLAKRGQVSDTKLATISQQIATETGRQINIASRHLELVWSAYGQRLLDDQYGRMFEALAQEFRAYSLRLQLTLSQAAGSGLTVYNAIDAAIKTFPDFPWGQAARYVSEDILNYIRARRAVGRNQYYGFRRDLGPARSTQFRSLGWLCMHLLCLKKGALYGALSQYGGYNNAPNHQAQLQQLITEYNPQPDLIGEVDAQPLIQAISAPDVDAEFALLAQAEVNLIGNQGEAQ